MDRVDGVTMIVAAGAIVIDAIGAVIAAGIADVIGTVVGATSADIVVIAAA